MTRAAIQPDRKLAYSIEEACAATCLSPDTLYRYHHAGRVKMIKAGRRTLIPADALMALIASFPEIPANAA